MFLVWNRLISRLPLLYGMAGPWKLWKQFYIRYYDPKMAAYGFSRYIMHQQVLSYDTVRKSNLKVRLYVLLDYSKLKVAIIHGNRCLTQVAVKHIF